MQVISSAAAALLAKFTPVQLRVYLGDTLQPMSILSASYTASGGGSEQFTIGCSCSAQAALQIAGAADMEGKTLKICWAINEEEYPLMVGTVTAETYTGGVSELQMADAMSQKGAEVYAPAEALLAECTLKAALEDCAAQLGTTLNADIATLAEPITLETGVGNLPSDITIAAAAGQMAALLGGSAAIDRSGALTVLRFTASVGTSDAYSGGDSLRLKAYQVTGLIFRRTNTVTVDVPGAGAQTVDSTEDFPAGTTGAQIVVENNLATQALTDNAWAQMQDLSFYSGSFEIPGGLLYEPFDQIDIRATGGTYRTLITQISLSIDGGVRGSVTSAGAPVYGGAKNGYITKRLQDMAKKVYTLQTSVEGLSSTAATQDGKISQIEQTAEHITASVAEQGKALSDLQIKAGEISATVTSIVENGVDKVTTSFGLTIDESYVHIQRSGSEMENRLDETGMYVMRGNEVMLQANKDGVIGTDMTVRNYLIIGSHARFEDYTDDDGAAGTACFYI